MRINWAYAATFRGFVTSMLVCTPIVVVCVEVDRRYDVTTLEWLGGLVLGWQVSDAATYVLAWLAARRRRGE